MKSNELITKIFLFILVLIILAGCSGASNSREAVISFDGENTQYKGPEAVTAGDMKVILDNDSEYDLDVLVLKLEDGKTWQEVLDYIGPPGSDVKPQPWMTNITTMGVPDEPGAYVYQLQEGSYAVVLCRCNEILAPTQIWPVTALEVKE